MRRVFQTISWLALAGTVLPSLFYYAGAIDLDRVKWIMILATAAWFLVTPLWMGRKRAESQQV